MIFEFTVSASVVVDSVGSKLAAMIEYQLPHGTEPPEFVHQLVDYKYAFLGIDLGETPRQPAPSWMHHPELRKP